MKKYRVIYLPHGKEDKEWIYVTADSKQEAIKNFTYGIVIKVEEEQ
jgi:hypothetical protein